MASSPPDGPTTAINSIRGIVSSPEKSNLLGEMYMPGIATITISGLHCRGENFIRE